MSVMGDRVVPLLDREIRVLLAVVDDPFPTYGSVMAATGFTRTMVRVALDRLRGLGFVTSDPGRKGTIRATVTRPVFDDGRVVSAR